MNANSLQNPQIADSESVTPEQLYTQHAAPLRRYLTRLVDDPSVAEDLCQDTFVRALRSWHTRRSGGSPSGWLYQIARNLARDEWRRRDRLPSVALHEAQGVPGSEPLDQRWSSPSADRAWALACLRPSTRMILLLYGAGYRAPEIAAMTGRETKAVLMIISHGRRRLRTSLEQVREQ